MPQIVALDIPGYAQGLNPGIPATNDVGASAGLQSANYKIPPVVWMIAFLVIGYVGLRMMLE